MNLTALLTHLERAELVRALQATEYFFKHALVQDTAYESLLKNERKRMHRVIGLTLEQGKTEHAVEAAELAYHFARAGDDAKTAMYAQRAGDAAARVFAFPEAHTYYKNALDALTRLPDTPVQRRERVNVIVNLVAVSLRAQGPEWSLEQLRVAETLLRDLAAPEDRERWARVHFWMGDAYSHLNQQREAIAYLQQALDAAQEGIEDETLLAIPSNVIGRALAAQGKFAEAEPLLAKAAPLLEKSANWYEWVLAMGFMGFALAAQGDTGAGLKKTSRAFARAQELGTPVGIVDCHIFESLIYEQSGEREKMLEHANAGLAVATGLNDQLMIILANNLCAWAHTRLGHFAEAELYFERAQALTSQMGGHVFFGDLFQAAHAELALRQGNIESARARAQAAIETAEQVGSIFSRGLAERILGQTLSGDAAVEHFEASFRLFEAGNARIEAARTRTVWGESLHRPPGENC